MNEREAPEIRFKGFTDDWEQRKFSDITYPSGEKNRDNLPYESYSITNESGFVPQDEKFENGGTMRDADKRMYYIVSPQSFAYNPARINVGSIGYQNTSKNVIVSSLYEIFKTTEEVDDRFLWHWFKSDDFQKLIVQLQEGGVRLYFYYDKLCMGAIALPSLAEQQRIGAYLDKLDNLITLHQRKHKKLISVKKSMLEKMFPQNGAKVPEIRFEGFTDDWEQRKVGDTCKINGRIGFRGYTEKDIISKEAGGVLTFSPTNIVDNKLTMDCKNTYITREKYDESPEIMIKNGDILFVKTGSTLGKSALVTGLDEDASINPQIVVMRVEEGTEAFFSNVLITQDVLKQVAAVRIGGAVPTMTETELKNFAYYEPTSKAEKNKIGEYFSNLDNFITLHQRELDKLVNIKKSMLEKMFA